MQERVKYSALKFSYSGILFLFLLIKTTQGPSFTLHLSRLTPAHVILEPYPYPVPKTLLSTSHQQGRGVAKTEATGG